jgi:hypothetical protein
MPSGKSYGQRLLNENKVPIGLCQGKVKMPIGIFWFGFLVVMANIKQLNQWGSMSSIEIIQFPFDPY